MNSPEEIQTESKAKHYSNPQQYLTLHEIKTKKMVHMAIEGKELTEIGKEVYPDTKYPAQTVYRSLRQPTAQRILTELVDFAPEDVRTRIAQSIQHFNPANPKSTHVKVLEIGARVHGMLKDVSETKEVRITLNAQGSIADLVSSLNMALKSSNDSKASISLPNTGQSDTRVELGQNSTETPMK